MAVKIEPLDEDTSLTKARESGVPEYMAGLNIFRVLLKEPVSAKSLNDLLTGLIFRSPLPHRLRELVIMRIGWLTDCTYEWTQHFDIAKAFGLTEEELIAVRNPEDSKVLSEEDRLALKAVEEVVRDGKVSQATLEQLSSRLEEPALIDLVASIGAWHMVSVLVRSLGIELEQDKQPWPPDGRGPS